MLHNKFVIVLLVLLSVLSLTACPTTLPTDLSVPAEFSSTEGILITPSPSSYYKKYFADIIKSVIAAGAKPYLVVASQSEKNDVINKILFPNKISPSSVEFLEMKYDTVWTRDFAPLFYFNNGRREILNSQYYYDLRDDEIKRPDDNAIPLKIGKLWHEKVVTTDVYTEGGNFMTDGKGRCFLTTVIFHKNPNKTTTQITDMFKTKLGCKNIYYVDPVPGERTGHIDMFAKIVNEDTILISQPHPASDLTEERKKYFKKIYDFFSNIKNSEGAFFKVVPIPALIQGKTIYSYTNSLIVNNYVIVPIFNKIPLDLNNNALRIYKETMPGYTIVGIDSWMLLRLADGSIHCTTSQVPTKKN